MDFVSLNLSNGLPIGRARSHSSTKFSKSHFDKDGVIHT
jgi:hypothetical protein